MAGVLKLGRKSAIYLFVLVITGSFTLKNVDEHDGYILSDVSELFVARAHFGAIRNSCSLRRFWSHTLYKL